MRNYLGIFIIMLLLSFFSDNSIARDNKNRIAVGGGIYNFMKHGSDNFNQSSIAYNFEYFSKKKAFGFIKPLLGFLGTTENAFYGYFGLSTDLYFFDCKCFLLSPSLAVGGYEDGDQIRLGHTLEFRSGGDISYRFRNDVRVGVGLYHISNAGLGKENPGTESILFKYQIPF